MPHLIIEHTPLTESGVALPEMMQAVHSAAFSTGIFNESDIKIRAQEYEAALIGGKQNSFIHVLIYLISGRDRDTKKRLTEAVHRAVRDQFPAIASISVDARDLDREVYTKSMIK
jgi:5-carboxymethyl-2-hydroxymuconate isomerase